MTGSLKSMRGFVEAKVLLDPAEAVGVVIDSHRDFMDMVAHAFHIGANPLKFGANAVEPLRKNADLCLCFFIARCDLGELRGDLRAHFLQQADGVVVGLFVHVSNYIGNR